VKNNNIIGYKNGITKTLSGLNKTEYFWKLYSTLWYSGFPCFDLKGVTAHNNGDRSVLKYCEWKGAAVPCSSIFTTFPTGIITKIILASKMHKIMGQI